MARALIGALAAAIVMFVLGFIFFATPLAELGTSSLPDRQAAAVQASLAQNLPETATYSVPSDNTAGQTTLYGRGPIATIHYNSRGYAIGDAGTMIGGFLHMLIVTLLMAVGLFTLAQYLPSFGERVRLLVLGTVGATVFMRLGEPIWFHHDWGHAIYMFIVDSVSLIAAGLVILKLLPRGVATPAAAEAEAQRS